MTPDDASHGLARGRRGPCGAHRPRAARTARGRRARLPPQRLGERALAEAFGARGVDGLIIAPAGGDHGYLLRDRAAGMALVGFDDVVLGDVVQPGSTVLAQDPTGLGRGAAERLFARLDGFDGPTQELVLKPTLIARGSGELAAPVAAT